MCARMGHGVATPMNLGVTADVRPRGPHLNWWHVAKATKLQRPLQAKKAAVPAQDSAATGGASYRSRGPAARSLHTSVPAWSVIGQASLGDGVWKGHAV